MDLDDRADIDAPRRFVEYDQVRVLHQRLGDHDLLLVAAGQFHDLHVIAGRTHLELLDPGAADLVGLAPRQEEAAARKFCHETEIDVAGNRHGLEETLDLAVFRDIGDAGAHRGGGNAVAHWLAVQDHFAAVEEIPLQNTGDDLEGLGAAGADQAEHPGDLSGEYRERIVLNHRRHLEVLYGQHPLAGRPHTGLARAIERVRQIAPDHRLHDAGAVEILSVVGHDMLAVAQDGNPVGKHQCFLERVRDEHDRHAAAL